jgi:hypothetical protein
MCVLGVLTYCLHLQIPPTQEQTTMDTSKAEGEGNFPLLFVCYSSRCNNLLRVHT